MFADNSILQMAIAPNFGVFLDFVHPFLTEVDFNNHIVGHGMHDHNAILIGGKGPNEGNILVTGEGLIMGPLCDAYFGYDEVMHHYLTVYVVLKVLF